MHRSWHACQFPRYACALANNAVAAPHVARPISDTEMALRLGNDSRAEVRSAMICVQT